MEEDYFYYNDLSFIINKDRKTVTCILEYFEEELHYHKQAIKGELVIPSKAIDESNSKEYLVTEIGVEAFYECRGLTSVFIPASVRKIGDCSFRGCNGLKSIVVDRDNPVYDSRDNCNAIIETETNTLIAGCNNTIIPSSVKKIDFGVFWDCNELTSIVIPKSVDSIGRRAFYGCYGLNSIKVEEGNKKYDSRGECNALIETATNTLLKGSNNGYIPNSVTKIDEGAFEGCSGLKSIVIPDSVTQMEVCAFADCTALTEVKISNSLKIIDENAFARCESLTEVTIPDSVTHIYYNAFSDCTKLEVINFGDSVIEIWEYAFRDTAWFNNQPDGMVYAGLVAYIYKGEMAEETVTIKEGCKAIADSAFKCCKKLKKILIPNSVTAIGAEAFRDCTNIRLFTIGNSIKQVGLNAFRGCTNLVSVAILNAEVTFGWRVFDGCNKLTSIFCKTTNPTSHFDLPNEETTIYIPQGTFETYKAAGFDERRLVEISTKEMDCKIAELKR